MSTSEPIAESPSFFQSVANVLGEPLFTVGEFTLTTLALSQAVLLIVLAYIISAMVRKALGRVGAYDRTLQPATAYALGRLSHYALVTLGLLLALGSLGLNLTHIAIIAGALGVGIGFGLQSIANNFVSGLIILFERKMKVGDIVEIASGIRGVVKDINVRSTRITTMDNLDIIVPNSEFVGGQFINWTLSDRLVRMHVPFGVAYGSDKDEVRAAVMEAASRLDFVAQDEQETEPMLWLVGFGDSSLDFELLLWVDLTRIQRPGQVVPRALWEIHTSLRDHGIQIPFPQRDLHLRTGWERLDASVAEGSGGSQQGGD